MSARQSSVVRTPVRELKRPPSAWSGASAEESSDRDPLLIPIPQKSNPTERMRRIDTMLEFAVTGFLGIGSALLISFYVTGPPRFDDMASHTTLVLLLTLISGCSCCLPSWISTLVMLCSKRGLPSGPPPHARFLRFSSLLALLFALVHAMAGIILYVLLEEQASFISFCMRNVPSAVPEDCIERWNRNWISVLSVTLVLLFHLALGFPVFRYARK